MVRLSEAEVSKIRSAVRATSDWRCQDVDDDGCRCLRRRDHAGEHDHSYTPHTRALGSMMVQRSEARPIVVADGAGRPTSAGLGFQRSLSEQRGHRCCYATGHTGYHCNVTGTLTWSDETPGATT